MRDEGRGMNGHGKGIGDWELGIGRTDRNVYPPVQAVSKKVASGRWAERYGLGSWHRAVDSWGNRDRILERVRLKSGGLTKVFREKKRLNNATLIFDAV